MHLQKTARQKIAQVAICGLGCCCGRVEKGKPPVPVDWLKKRWKEENLLGAVHLTLAGCLGPCDLANVVLVMTTNEMVWLGGLRRQVDFQEILDWAVQCKLEGRPVPLPPNLTPFTFTRFIPRFESNCNFP